MEAPLPTNERERLDALHSYQILDSGAEAEYDDLVLMASQIFHAPIALITLVDETRQWFKARVGMAAPGTPRDQAFCAHAILDRDTLVVPDATHDERFADNPLVLSDPNIRFYAGAPLVTPEGHGLGTLCVIDTKSREESPPTVQEIDVLEALSRQVVRLLEYRRVTAQLADALDRVTLLEPLVPVCAWCRRVRDDKEYWSSVEAYLRREAGVEVTHGICPSCAVEFHRELDREP